VKADGTVRYQVRVSWMNGTKQVRVARRFKTFEAARRWATKAKHTADGGGTVQRRTRLTLDQYLDQWLKGLTVGGARTRVDYENVAKRYWRPTLGHHRLDQITRQHVKEVLARMSRPKAKAVKAQHPDWSEADVEAASGLGLSPRTVAQARAILRIALNAAVDDDLLAANVAAGKKLVPPQVQHEQQVLTEAQVVALLDGTREHDDLHALWAVLLTTGLRIGEALGLTWGDLELDGDEPTLHVRRALVRPEHGAAWVLEEPKTERSRRDVPLIPDTVTALLAHRDRQHVERLLAGAEYAPHGFVFASPTGEPLAATNVFKYRWRPMLTRLGLPPIRLHDTRHSAATMLLRAGEKLETVRDLLGHSTIGITGDIYAHVLKDTRHAAAANLQQSLRRARTGLQEQVQEQDGSSES
jgi:integrase